MEKTGGGQGRERARNEGRTQGGEGGKGWGRKSREREEKGR